MSDYDHRPGGSLKLKGDGEKKKKKKSHSSSERANVDSQIAEKDKAEAAAGADGSRPSGGRKLTEAERRFEETQRKRREERAQRGAKTSHKDRVSEFNAKLDRLSEHHDMPRIGPG